MTDELKDLEKLLEKLLAITRRLITQEAAIRDLEGRVRKLEHKGAAK